MVTNTVICPIADTFENLSASNVIFKNGQKIYDTDNKKWKTGDGEKTWSELEYDTSASGGGSDGSGDLNGVSQEELERLNYYGDKDIVPSDEILFDFTPIDDYTVSIALKQDVDKNSITELVIPYKYIDENGKEYKVTNVGDDAFLDCSKLTSAILPHSIIGIGICAFTQCYRLASILISNNVTSIGNYAFSYCDSLKNITIPDTASIGNGAFYDCGLKSIVIPDSVTKLGEGIFGNFFEDLTIICNPDSTAEAYAKENGIKYAYNYVKSEDLGDSSNGIIKLDPVTVDVYIDLDDPENLPHSDEFLLESLNIKSMDLNEGFYLLPVNYTMIGQQYYGEVFISVNKQSVILYDDEPYESVTHDYVYMFKNELYAESEDSHIYPIATKIVDNLDYDDNGSIYALSQRQGYELNKQLEGLPNIIADFEAIANNVVTFDNVQDDLTNPDLDDELGHRLPPSVNAMKQYVAENSGGGSLLDAIHLENMITGYGDLCNVNKEVLESINFSSLNLTEGDYKLPVTFNPIWGGISSVELLVHISKEEHTAETWDNNDNPILKTTNSYYYNVQIKGETYTSSNGSEFYPMSTRIIDNLEISDSEIIYALSQNQGIVLNNKINELSERVDEISGDNGDTSYLDEDRMKNDIYDSDLADEELCMNVIPSVKFLKDYISNMFYLDGDNLKISIDGKTFTLTPDAE